MALADYQYRDPAIVLDIEQRQQIKLAQGCAACELRNRLYSVGGKYTCSLPGNAPGKLGFCKQWQHDEGVGNGGGK